MTPNLFSALARERLVALAARHKLPAVYFSRSFVTEGGLISYAPDTIDQYHRAAGSIDRILKGEKPAGADAGQIRDRRQPADRADVGSHHSRAAGRRRRPRHKVDGRLVSALSPNAHIRAAIAMSGPIRDKLRKLS